MAKNGKPHPWKVATNKHAWAMLRLGGQEIRGAMYNGSNVAQPTEYGILGHPTPGEIADDKSSNSSGVHGNPGMSNEPSPPAINELTTSEPQYGPEAKSSPLQQSLKEAEVRAQSRTAEPTRSTSMERDR